MTYPTPPPAEVLWTTTGLYEPHNGLDDPGEHAEMLAERVGSFVDGWLAAYHIGPHEGRHSQRSSWQPADDAAVRHTVATVPDRNLAALLAAAIEGFYGAHGWRDVMTVQVRRSAEVTR